MPALTDGVWAANGGGSCRVTDSSRMVTDGVWAAANGGGSCRVTDSSRMVTDGVWAAANGGGSCRVTDRSRMVTDGGWRATDAAEQWFWAPPKGRPSRKVKTTVR